jgi:hypothetical protein
MFVGKKIAANSGRVKRRSDSAAVGRSGGRAVGRSKTMAVDEAAVKTRGGGQEKRRRSDRSLNDRLTAAFFSRPPLHRPPYYTTAGRPWYVEVTDRTSRRR